MLPGTVPMRTAGRRVMFKSLTHAYLKAMFKMRGPWVTKFQIGGESYGGSRDYSDYNADPRIPRFIQQFPEAKSILELGSLEGGHSFQLARLQSVEKVVAIEGRQRNVAKAEFVQRLLGMKNVSFLEA